MADLMLEVKDQLKDNQKINDSQTCVNLFKIFWKSNTFQTEESIKNDAALILQLSLKEKPCLQSTGLNEP